MHTGCWSRSPRKAGGRWSSGSGKGSLRSPWPPHCLPHTPLTTVTQQPLLPVTRQLFLGLPTLLHGALHEPHLQTPSRSYVQAVCCDVSSRQTAPLRACYHCHVSKRPENLLGCVQRWVLWIRFQPFVCSMPWPGSRMQGHPALAEPQPPTEGPHVTSLLPSLSPALSSNFGKLC